VSALEPVGSYLRPHPVGPDPVVEAAHSWSIEIEAEGYRLALDQWTDFSISWNHDGATTAVEVNLVEEMVTFMRALVSDLVFVRDRVPLFRFRIMSTEDVITRDAATVRFTCATYESILARRIITEDWVLEALDVDAAWTLIQYTQAQPYGDLGITREPTPPVGANRQRTLTIGTSIRDAINDFAEADNGFDWWIDVYKEFHMAKPRRGHFHEPHQWQIGGEVAELVRNNPDDMYASQVLTVGARNETQIPDGAGGHTIYPPPTPQLVTLGTQPFGLWQTAISYSDVVTVASLAEKADYELRDRANVRPFYKLTLQPGIWTPHYGLGDIVMLRTVFRGGDVRVPIRIEEMELAVTVDGAETVSMSARAEEPETYVGPPRPGLPPMPIDPIGTTNGRTSQATRLRPWDDLAAIVKGIDRRVSIQEREHQIVGGGGGGPGPSAPAAYTHQQASPATVWSITHGLGFFPNVRIVTAAGSNAVGDVAYPDSNHMTITFSAPLSGAAYLS
jgi:hypothetical protein